MWSRCQKLVRAQEQLRLNRTWKVSIIYTWLVKTLDNLISSFALSLILFVSTVHWLRCFLFLNATNRRLRSVHDSTEHIRCGGPAALSYPSAIVKKRSSSLSSIARLGIRYPRMSVHMTHEFLWVHVSANWHSWAWQTRTYVHTYITRIDPSFKASR